MIYDTFIAAQDPADAASIAHSSSLHPPMPGRSLTCVTEQGAMAPLERNNHGGLSDA
jgi:hypothetical protein